MRARRKIKRGAKWSEPPQKVPEQPLGGAGHEDSVEGSEGASPAVVWGAGSRLGIARMILIPLP